MIFVTVGTHEQQFDRLIKKVDNLVLTNEIIEEVIIQTGYSTYEPKYCVNKKFFSYKEMVEYMSKARIIITHGGPSTFIMPLQFGKTPIVVPRQEQFNEHINNHQLEFVKLVKERQGNIILVENIDDLPQILGDYEEDIKVISKEISSNNFSFNEKFNSIVNEII